MNSYSIARLRPNRAGTHREGDVQKSTAARGGTNWFQNRANFGDPSRWWRDRSVDRLDDHLRQLKKRRRDMAGGNARTSAPTPRALWIVQGKLGSRLRDAHSPRRSA
jgi:hypothetical protein